MGHIFYIMGKSSTGKDTIYENLLGRQELGLKPLIPYTTRPIRAREQDGVEYHFTDEAGLLRLRQAGKVIELREYHTVHGVWSYFTVDDDHIDLNREDYLGIGVLESYRKIRDYFGPDRVIPIYIQVEDGNRLERAAETGAETDPSQLRGAVPPVPGRPTGLLRRKAERGGNRAAFFQ